MQNIKSRAENHMNDVLVKIKSFLKHYSFVQGKAQSSDWDGFYQAFEERFRGNPDLIKSRLSSRYKQKMQDLLEKSNAFKNGTFIDVGCGRGEMLDLAKSVGFKTLGIEPSHEAGRIAKSLGHQVISSDGLSYLSSQPAESAVFVSCLRVMEHCPPQYNWKLLGAIYDVLKPGGAVLIETPSLFSLWASHRQFYLDPTHDKPVHPELLRFMCEKRGFSKVDELEFDDVDCPERAHLVKGSSSQKLVGEFQKLEDWLYGPVDAAVWAIK